MKFMHTANLLLGLLLATTPTLASRDQCLDQCSDATNMCRSAPGANISTCVSDYEACKSSCMTLGTTSSTSATTTAPSASYSGSGSGGNQCLDQCSDASNMCRSAPGANISTCVSDYEVCKSSCAPVL